MSARITITLIKYLLSCLLLLTISFAYAPSVLSDGPPITLETAFVGPLEPEVECSCVSYIRSLVSSLPRGDADQLQTNSVPAIGGVVKLRYGDIYHVAYIDVITDIGMFISEKNFKKTDHCSVTHRFLPWSDTAIIGFWLPDASG